MEEQPQDVVRQCPFPRSDISVRDCMKEKCALWVSLSRTTAIRTTEVQGLCAFAAVVMILPSLKPQQPTQTVKLPNLRG